MVGCHEDMSMANQRYRSSIESTPQCLTCTWNLTWQRGFSDTNRTLAVEVQAVSYTHLDVYKRQVYAGYYCEQVIHSLLVNGQTIKGCNITYLKRVFLLGKSVEIDRRLHAHRSAHERVLRSNEFVLYYLYYTNNFKIFTSPMTSRMTINIIR